MQRYFLNIYIGIKTILIGMFITLKHMFTKSVTVQYPHKKLDIPERCRNLLLNKIEDCIGCYQCARACPVYCITMETIKAFEGENLGLTSDGSKKRLWIPVFDIDMAKCCYCGLCTYPCPTKCLIMTDKYEYSTYKRDNLIFHFTNVDAVKAAELREKDHIRKMEKEK
ncbi:NADPH-quinone oxidoreductase [bacterium SM23_31]|nr:MAG: NADPH-quinone oxidoreductase [bacterium SM23_31]